MYLLLILRRYLFSRWIMSSAAIVAVLLAVFSLVVVMSVFEGFGDQMREMVRGTTSHLVITTYQPVNLPFSDEIADEVRAIPHVTGAAPYLETLAMFQAQQPRGHYSDYLHVRGIDPIGEASVGYLAHYLLRTEDLLELYGHPDRPIGRALDRKPLSNEEIAYLFSAEHRDKVWSATKGDLLRLNPALGSELDEKVPPPIVVGIQALIGPARLLRYGSLVTLTTYSPQKEELKTGEFLVVGAFHTGLFEVDLRTVYMPLAAACEFLDVYDPGLPDADGTPDMGGWRVSGIGVALDDYDARKVEVQRQIEGRILPRYEERLLAANPSVAMFRPFTSTWEERKRNLLQAVRIEKGIVSLIIGILVIFVGAIIFLILTLNVTEKRRDIGILKAVGAHETSVLAIFLLHGGTICLVGLALGFFAGLEFCTYINEIHDFIFRHTGYQLFPPDIYYMDRIPVAFKTADLLQITAFTVSFGFLGSLLPALWAARQDPIKAIKFE